MAHQLFERKVQERLVLSHDVVVALDPLSKQFFRQEPEVEEIPVTKAIVCGQHGVEVDAPDRDTMSTQKQGIIFDVVTDDLSLFGKYPLQAGDDFVARDSVEISLQ